MNLIVDNSTECLCCGEVIPSKGWKYAAVTDTPQGTLVFCCSACRLEAGFGGTGRICSVIPEGTPIPNSSGGSYKQIKSSTVILLNLFLGWLGVHRFYAGKTISGILYAISLGFIGIGVAIDMFLIATGKFDDSMEEATESEKKVCWAIGIILSILLLVIFTTSN